MSHPRSPVSFTAPPPDRFALSGPSLRLDRRIHAYRNDVADVTLADRVFAPHYARAQMACCVAAAISVRDAPSSAARAVSQLVHGEAFAVLDISGGWAWGRCSHDDYVGYLPAESLGEVIVPTHRVVAPLALVFPAPDIKAPPVAHWPIGTRLAGEREGDFLRVDAGFVHHRHVAAVDTHEPDVVAVAERLLGQPYLWGGRGGGGVDCSGLVQVALDLGGIAAPRDSDLQRALGEDIPADAPLMRGDLIFFPGHVGLMGDDQRLLHATAHWMAVVTEPLADVTARLGHLEQAIVARRRIGS